MWQRVRNRARRPIALLEHTLALGSLLILFMVFSPIPDWILATMDRQSPLAPAKYIICLGGNPSRVIEATRLLQEGYGEKLIVSNHGDASIRMRDLAIDWGAPPDKVLMDVNSWKTLDHPDAIRRAFHLDPANDLCIIVTSYTHMARSRACFRRAGYRHILMREPRWERQFRTAGHPSWKRRFLIFPKLVYEGAAWVEYWVRGVV